MRRRLLLACALALACVAAPVAAQEAQLASVLGEVHERYGFPGATAAIALPDGTVVTAATGLADVEAGRAMTPETPMLAASIGKSFVAAAVLALETEGRLSRDDLLSDHLGDRPWFDALPNSEAITVDHLLHHTSGLPDHVHMSEFQQAWEGLVSGSTFDAEDLIGFVAGREPLFEAGQAWQYSDTGYVLLGLVIEEVTGQGWHDAVRTRLLDPLALNGTVPSDRPDLPGLAVGYVDRDNPFGLPARTADGEGRLLWNPAVESAGGGFASTSADLVRWGHLPVRRRGHGGPLSRQAARRCARGCGGARHPLRRGRGDLRRHAARAGLWPWRLDPRLCLQPAPLRGAWRDRGLPDQHRCGDRG